VALAGRFTDRTATAPAKDVFRLPVVTLSIRLLSFDFLDSLLGSLNGRNNYFVNGGLFG
jgi:hypothetical protein